MPPRVATAAPGDGSRRAKRELRALVLARRDALGAERREDAARAIVRKVLARPEVMGAACVMSYCAFGSELSTAELNGGLLAAGKRLVLPKVDRESGRLHLYAVRDPATELVAGPWGIMEPDPMQCRPVEGGDLDCIFVPGAAFDRRGGRLGYGKGFYDRLFAALSTAGSRPARIAGCFTAQIVEAVPMEPFDVPMDAVITEDESYLTTPRGAGPSRVAVP